MPFLRDDEIRRLLSFLKNKIRDSEKLAEIEDELKSEFGAEFLREPEILLYFPEQKIEINFAKIIWLVRIIPYTSLRMIQRGIGVQTIIVLFRRFLEFCRNNDEIISAGAYTIFGKPFPRSPLITLRFDVDEIKEAHGKAHTVTLFIGRGDSANTAEIDLS